MLEVQAIHAGRGGPASWQASGDVASMLLNSGFNVNALRPAIADEDMNPMTGLVRANSESALRANATLQVREWILLDTAVINVARRHLVGVQDLLDANLTYPIQDALGITRIEWQKIGTMTGAELSMSGISQTANDRQEYAVDAIPLPIVHKEFKMNIRQLATTRRFGIPLDVTQAALASRLVTEYLESMLFLGASVIGTNTPIYGYTTGPHRVTGSVTASWATTTGANIITDILAMIQALKNNNMYGPYMLYVPSAVYTHFGSDYVSNAVAINTIMQRVLAVPGIAGVRESKDLTSSNVIMVQMTEDVVDLVDGMSPTSVQWDSPGGMEVNFKVMAIMVPRMKADYVNQCGVAHYS
jgi:uncharacterized linocin/CFP29 family protein